MCVCVCVCEWVFVVVVVVVVASTARLSPVQNWGKGKMGCKIALSKSGQSARVHTVEGIGEPIATIHIGDRYPSDPVATGTVPVVPRPLRYPFRLVWTHVISAGSSKGGVGVGLIGILGSPS